MNWSKNLYILMLSMVIVLSGCFGTGTTDGQDPTSADNGESEQISSNIYASFGIINPNSTVLGDPHENDTYVWDYVMTIDQNASEMIQITTMWNELHYEVHQDSQSSYQNNTWNWATSITEGNSSSFHFHILTDCVSGIDTNRTMGSGPVGTYLHPVGDSCSHDVYLRALFDGSEQRAYVPIEWEYSIVWEVTPVSVQN